MNNSYIKVREFHIACDIPMPNKPTKLDNGGHTYTIDNFASTLDGLVKQMKFASSSGFGGEVLARASYMLEEIVEFLTADTIEDQVDALGDGLYFNLGTLTLMNVEPENIFNLIHNANMRKVVNGKVLRNEQNKIVKPEGWYGPEEEIKKEIEKQSNPCKVCNGERKPIYGLECPECEASR